VWAFGNIKFNFFLKKSIIFFANKKKCITFAARNIKNILPIEIKIYFN